MNNKVEHYISGTDNQMRVLNTGADNTLRNLGGVIFISLECYKTQLGRIAKQSFCDILIQQTRKACFLNLG